MKRLLKPIRSIAVVALILALGAAPALAERPVQKSKGQLVYVPAYTMVHQSAKGKTYPLTTTLLIHNTDPEAGIEVTSAKYFDEEGNASREYVQQPISVTSFGTVDILINNLGKVKGIGGGMVISWRARNLVSPPVVECIFIGTTSQQGISFRSVGRVIREYE